VGRAGSATLLTSLSVSFPRTDSFKTEGLACTFQLLPEEGVLSFFRLNRREWFSWCSHITQRIRETRATSVGNTLLGNTVLPTHAKEHAMPKSAYYTLTWSSSSQVYALYEGQGSQKGLCVIYKRALGRNKLSFYGNRCILWGCGADFDLCLKP
jgi:hypothetical protein